MMIRPQIVDYIRTFVRDDYTTNDQIEAQLNEDGWDGFAPFLSAIFFYAIDLHFDGKRDDRAIRQFVAEMRSDNADVANQIDASQAENAIFAVLDSSVDLEVSPEMLGRVQTFAVHKALVEANLSDAELDSLLNRAKHLAES
ncbi:hypothetical protein I0C86_14740 [Plantactinospora sp. S1510]|uniref:Uncharacterized protein n=1 Tax=Plantactinospora alkalitolerans TaxID=2789879 RepID=A0ABS0GVG7_9ACTN|nr:hypothetical protein [Plantactinospora alkalitolerans]MBF9130203.1 hypothetical protein [Plantactinospora alkalitolerans]